ncbi:hypothetical protein OCV62_01630 [Gallintestinimicrobium propionicum]|uniref:DUF3226 domain-containing protein n=1 Tax=Gallintestinimicrobium propionicum TaxID=2981770 RepID=UPI000822CA00|nr:DUF3226 domain-containing protein [Gallintestinimicrobium propionicum]MCU6688700.1 hypothetical protein [Gallintestinimicrobium propionicum]SCI40326.1 Uncharacterised protein [uncultured Clostridium sp.]
MRAVILCEGTTDLLMIQYVLQYRYDWEYEGFWENSVTNKLLKKTLKKDGSNIEIQSCGGITNIPIKMKSIKDQLEYVTRKEEFIDKVIILIDHDTIDSNREFIEQINENLGTQFVEEDINSNSKWIINNFVLGQCQVDLFFKCLPENETGAIEKIMLEALTTDEVEENLIKDSNDFITEMAQKQNRYLRKKSRISKAVFNTYFAIRIPEEKYDERARILKAYDWKNNETINKNFNFLDIPTQD